MTDYYIFQLVKVHCSGLHLYPDMSCRFIGLLQDAYEQVTDIVPLSPNTTPRGRARYFQGLAEAIQWVGQMAAHLHGVLEASVVDERVDQPLLHHGSGLWGMFCHWCLPWARILTQLTSESLVRYSCD